MPQTIELTVLNRLGIHARPAAELVRCALKFKSTKITLLRDGEAFLSTSILEVLSASLEHGALFTVQADGPEEGPALEALAALMVHLRDEEELHP
jgi:phosphocarrier protein HPr